MNLPAVPVILVPTELDPNQKDNKLSLPSLWLRSTCAIAFARELVARS
jgi:hypothetical protein